MKLEGSLQETRLVDLLHQLAALGKTGILTVQSQTDIIAVTFFDGRIVAADALNEPMEEGLGQVIVSQGLVTSEQFSQIVTRSKAENERVAHLLTAQGLVGRDQVLQAFRLQTYRLLLQLLTWREGDFNVFVGDEISYEEGFDALTVEELLIRGVADLSSESPIPGPIPDVTDRFARVASAPVPRVLGVHGDGPSLDESGVLWISPSESQVYECLEVERAGDELMAMTGLDEYAVRFALYRLLELGLLEPRAAPQAEPPLASVAQPAAPLADAPAAAALGTAEEEERSDLSSLLDPVPGTTRGGGASPLTEPLLEGGLTDLESSSVLESGLSDTSSLLRNTDQLSALLEDAPVSEGTDVFLRDTGSFHGIKAPTAQAADTGATDAYLTDLVKTNRTRRLELIGTTLDIWLGRVMAFGLFLTLGLALSLPSIRNGLFFPFPWQSGQRAAFEVSQNSTLSAKIDRGVRTYYLLYGRFPEQLGVLADLELLSPADNKDGRGRQLEYTSSGRHYTLQPLEGGEPVPGMERTAEVARDFLLDPDYVRLDRQLRQPLVLLD